MWSSSLKLVRAQEWLQLNQTWKFIPGCEGSPQHAFFVCTFSCFSSCPSTVHWLRCFLFLNAANRQLHSVLDSAKRVPCRGPAALSYPFSIVKKRRSSLSSITRLGIQYPCVSVHVNVCDAAWVPLHAREHQLTFLSVTNMYVHTHVHWENRSLIQSLALMRSAIMVWTFCGE